MGGFMGIGGASWKTDRKTQLGAFGKMENLFNFALPAGESETKAGASDLNTSGDYWKKILSGNRAAVSEAVAPEANQVRAGADAQKRQAATLGTARGGGTNASNRTRDDETMAKVDNAIFGARGEAGKEVAKIGAAEGSLGAGLIGEASTSATNLASISGQARKDDYKLNQDMVGKVTSAIDNAMMAIFA